MKLLRRMMKRMFPRGAKRDFLKYKNLVLNRTTQSILENKIKALKIKDGSVICIHGMLSGFGHLVGGPESVIKAVLQAVPGSTIMMPSFPFDGTMQEYISLNPIYDINNTPSKSGLLSEAFRRMDGTVRSYHPTHPCVAIGPKARDLIEDSEVIQSPFGPNSTYARLNDIDDAVLLLLHTNSTSIVHRIQEIVKMPNLFLPNDFIAKGINRYGDMVDYNVRVHVPSIPLFIAIPNQEKDIVDYIWYPDYVLLFPEYNRTRILRKLSNNETKKILIERHNHFLEEEIYRVVTIREAEIMAVKVKPWLNVICRDITHNLDLFSNCYDYQKLKEAWESGLLSKW